ncbi:glycoside hydrolase family 43 protein [Motilibacter aurantiacus]|uniref:glycoside hydrolase family 43 protein n=1 Tax=Motilibacter aurantiacus TaxID=2714955 RepID=UPI001407388F|nr:glycoside hydrolase family 43 protein [Motilibacter aurantiacus]NHC45485.1 family 43 glycosylhydrolase [Motilibacter aurantiacus]
MPTPYRNPVFDGYFADPFVLRTADGYVAYGTGAVVDGRAFEVLTSPDLVSWASAGGALELLADPSLGADYWAPEVAEHDGRWWMYYSVGHGDKGHHLRVAVADTPTGPFVDTGANLTPDERFAIDASPFRDADGTWYLFYARDVLEGDRVGTMVAVDVLEDMTRLRGEPRTLLRPSGDWQIFLREREMYGQVYDWHTLEGPFVRAHAGRYYLFYSGGNWGEESYGVAYAVADSPLGPWAEPAGVPPLLRTVPGAVLGPGHNCVVQGPEGQDVVVYHAWDTGRTARRMCLDPVVWDDSGPRVLGPTYGPTVLPRER